MFSPNDFEIKQKKYISHSVFDTADMHAYVDVTTALRSIRKYKGRHVDFVGDDSSYYEFYLMVTPNLSNQKRKEKFWLDWTPLNYGGWRYWLKCLECRHRRTKLYVTNDRVACMYCLGLIYTSKTGPKNKPLIRMSNHRKAIEILQQRHRMTYAGKPTRYGRYFSRYYQDLGDLAESFD
jgi:hypothetical protein